MVQLNAMPVMPPFRLTAPAGVAVALWAGLSCIPPPVSPCASDADCRTVNRCMSGVCQPFTPECTTNRQCLDAHTGEPYRCVPGQGICVPLTSTDCQTVLADNLDLVEDEAIYIGALMPLIGADESTGLPMKNAMELARRDFRQLGGLPAAGPGGRRRPLVVIACNDDADPVGAAQHLVNVAHVPAIVGAAFSGVTLNVANQVTLPGNTLLLSPSATSALITGLDDHDLVWRTSPSDALQALAVAGAVEISETRLRAAQGLMPADNITLAVVHKGDSYGAALADALFAPLVFNGQPANAQVNLFIRQNYGDPDDPPSVDYTSAVNLMLSRLPHLIIIIGTNEGVTQIFAAVEAGWPSGTPRPYYIFTDGGELPELLDLVTTNSDPDAVRARIMGSVPGTASTYNPFNLFKLQYSSTFTDGTNPQVFGAAGAYDAVYLLAYAAVALGTQPITGPNLATALTRLVPPGPKVIVGSATINQAFGALSANAMDHIDFDGASGPLDFDVLVGEAPSDIQLWCVVHGASPGEYVFDTTGRYYDASANMMAGTYVCP